ncbi:PREDICTED: uncharacterized protein LOC105556425 [Vollenhovia emeryi]|uniref:uncharacterized protein LOC105556425 n=1 Tax=Vollenhovia emeryi TaxID=411798 RepID=UPI0005F4E6A0|nr:PREDICTED: uncharacterized protein LOC105556425 [Vollenhovia emeryi]
MALKKVMNLLRNDKIEKREILILTDCKATIKALENNNLSVYKNTYVVEARRRINSLKKDYNIQVYIVWIPAHRGMAGNEIADVLAKEASQEESQDFKVPFTDFYAEHKIKEWHSTREVIEREAEYKGRYYFKYFYRKDARKSWFKGRHTERYFGTLMNRLRANHYNLACSLARKGYVESDQCECGGGRESLDHMVWACRKYSSIREWLATEIDSRGLENTDVEPIEDILKREDWDKLYLIYQFIRRTGRTV